MSETLEEHEKAKEAAEGGRRWSALLIAALAAGLAFSEQGAQHAQTAMSSNALAAADLWAQYQAKSIRANEAREIAALAQARDDLVSHLQSEATRFETEKGVGKAAVGAEAKAHEEARDKAHERLEAYDHASAALQLGIVLVTASVITGSTLLVILGGLLGLAGAVLGVMGFLQP